MIRAVLILLCLAATAAIVSAWAAAPIVRGPTAFDVAYARFLDAQARAGELTESEERFHKLATRQFHHGDWRERLKEPAWQLRITAPGHAFNVAYVTYSPDAVRARAGGSSFEWQHFHYEARKSRHGRYFVLRAPVWPPVIVLLLYPVVQFARWRRVRWFWRGIGWSATSTWRATRATGVRWCAMIAPPLLLSMILVPLWIISYANPIVWKSPTRYALSYSRLAQQQVGGQRLAPLPAQAAGTGQPTGIASLRSGRCDIQYTDFDLTDGFLCALRRDARIRRNKAVPRGDSRMQGMQYPPAYGDRLAGDSCNPAAGSEHHDH